MVKEKQKRIKEILFTDEKIFTVKETFNKQNDRIYAQLSKEARKLMPKIKRGHYPASVMVLVGRHHFFTFL